MAFWDKLKDKMKPSAMIAGIVDAVLDRLVHGYDLKVRGKIGEISFEIDPQITRKVPAVDLDKE